MQGDTHAIDPTALALFDVRAVCDGGRLDGTSRVLERVALPKTTYAYQVRDRALWRQRFDRPIFTLATRSAGTIIAAHATNRFATHVTIDGEQSGLFCFTTLLHGRSTLINATVEATATPDCGLVFRPGPATRLLISDDNERLNVFVEGAAVVSTLEQMLDRHLHRPLEFTPWIDWRCGLAASLKRQLDLLALEFQRPDGIASNAVALASMTDLLISLVLEGATHNYSDAMHQRAGQGRAAAAPAYVRRAEAFMASHSMEPIRMADIASAAGCSIRTLGDAFRRFRGKTTLQALHMFRLEQARAMLARGHEDLTVAQVARRLGFTNMGRFNAAYRQQFGQLPAETRQCVLR